MRNRIRVSLIYITVATVAMGLLLSLNSSLSSPVGIVIGVSTVLLANTYYRKLLHQFVCLVSLNTLVSLSSASIVYYTKCTNSFSLPYCGNGLLILTSFPLFVSMVIWLAKILLQGSNHT